MSFLSNLSNFIPFPSKKTSEEYYFALTIGETSVEAAVWGIVNNRLKIINSAMAAYDSEESLVESSNYALDEALADFQPEPVKILFGVPDFWLQDDDLKPEYLRLLRKMVKALDVEPMAYVSVTHAISHLIQKQQGIPPTMILVQVEDPLEISIIKTGKTVVAKKQKRSADLPQDIEKALANFHEVEVLPSKIVIYGNANLTKYKEELTGFSWMSQLPFLHLPKIETLGVPSVLDAVCLAGASEINSNIVIPRPNHIQQSPITITKQIKDDLLPRSHRGDDDLAEAGFMAGDIHQTRRVKAEEFLDGVDEEWPQELDSRSALVESKHHQYPVSRRDDHSALEKPMLGSGSFLSNIPFLGSIPKMSLIIPVVVAALLIGGYVLLPKAKVTIFIDLKILENQAQVTADPTIQDVNENDKKIPGKIIETTVNGSVKGVASGTKKVGDPAKGVVVIYNKTDAPKTFSQGTTLTGPNNLTFTLDSGVTIASQSAVQSGISFGKATVNATAVDIGPDGNIAAGKDLAIKSQANSSYSASVDTAFSGGISKDVIVVTADDQKKLIASLTTDLRKKAQDDLQAKLVDGMKILQEGLEEQITKQSFSKKVGDQASELTLDAVAKYKGTAYKDSDLKLIVSKLVATTVPDGYQLDLAQTETQADVAKIEKDGRLIFAAKFKAKLTPKINPEKVKKDIAGQSVDQAAAKLKQIENVIGSNIEISPDLPGPLKRLPFLSNNISVEITAK